MYPLSDRDALVIALCVGTVLGLMTTMLAQFSVEYWRHTRRARIWRKRQADLRRQQLARTAVRGDLRARLRRHP